MIKKGKVIQIILNKELNKFMFSKFIVDDMIATGKDLVVLKNPEYPNGLKGYFLSFRKNKPEDIFPILMDSKGIKKLDILEIECDNFFVKSDIYIKRG